MNKFMSADKAVQAGGFEPEFIKVEKLQHALFKEEEKKDQAEINPNENKQEEEVIKVNIIPSRQRLIGMKGCCSIPWAEQAASPTGSC